MQVTFLGTGTSHGVPTIDCMLSDHAHCPKNVCRKAQQDPRYRRTRCSILVERGDQSLLVDVTPDFREQVLREQVRRIDGVLLTHRHADHIMGIPDIRSYAKDKDNPLPVYGSAETLDTIRTAFDYAFNPATFVGGGIPRLSLHPIDGPLQVCGMTVTPVPVRHGNLLGCFGYRIGDLGYVPDMKSMDEEGRDILRGVNCLVLNCLRIEREHSTHLLLRESLELVRELGPKQCFFVHMTHDIDHETDSSLLDEQVRFAWDGLIVEVGEDSPQSREGRKGGSGAAGIGWGEDLPQICGKGTIWESEDEIAREVVDSALEVHRELGPGLLESIYEECLCRELQSRGLNLGRQGPLPATYKGAPVDCGYRLDIIVEDRVIVEVKSVSGLEPIHTAQLLTYLKQTNMKLGLLINFNVVLIKNGIRRIVNGL